MAKIDCIHAGVDIGSTTTKLIAFDEDGETIYSSYKRHNADQVQSVIDALAGLSSQTGNIELKVALTGSGAKRIAEYLSVPFIQEVVANSLALKENYDYVHTAIELGGQDAKMIFFSQKEEDTSMNVADMRMNGSCAGGTGAFIDEVASILKVPIEEFNDLASQGKCVYDISGRCGVYAKTDIQPLLNQGVSKADLALSAFHAIAKQTIGGLAQGLDIEKPVAFEGGPLTFNPRLVEVFAERLGLEGRDVIVPPNPEMMIARGAALSLDLMFADEKETHTIEELTSTLNRLKVEGDGEEVPKGRPFFANEEEEKLFKERSALPQVPHLDPRPGQVIRAYLGIDSGSTTTKFVLMDEQENILDSFYAPNEGDPLLVARNALIKVRDRFRKAGADLEILAAGATGYGELLFSKAFSTDYHVVETVAHARATQKYVKDATFILDIGGQDMKAIWLDHGVITNIVVNEACSSGCGSFLENFASSLNIPVQQIAKTAFTSKNPAVLGSRCTVFMNSSIVTEQRNGKLPEDIMAGLCRSIIENVFTKVIRISNLNDLGDRIVVQGGTFQNDAVLLSLEQFLGKEVKRAPYPGMMGAIGAALLTKDQAERNGLKKSTFIGLDAMDSFAYVQEANAPCPFCGNHCNRTILRFSNGTSWVTNNRCERGEITGDAKDPKIKRQLAKKQKEKTDVPNMFRLRQELLFKEYPAPKLCRDRGIVIGLPRVLIFWETMPFWTTLWRSLGFRVQISDFSSRNIYESGLSAVTSDTVCFPAKLVHGHIRNLVEKYKVDRVFMPSITTFPSENTEETSESMCAVVKGYPLVIRNSDNPQRKYDVPLDAPLFHWYQKEDCTKQVTDFMEETFGISRKLTEIAVKTAYAAQDSFQRQLKAAGKKVIDDVTRKGTYAVILASRPYQNDALVNHDLPDMFTSMGIPVLTVDSVPGTENVDLSRSRLDIVNNFHARMLSSAILAAENPHLEYVQIVSFGCGHDAYLSDEIIRMMKEISGKIPLVLKVDESDIQGPLRIRVRSFIETVNERHEKEKTQKIKELPDPYPKKFTRKSRKERVVLVPNTSHGFAMIMAAVFRKQGIRAVPLEVGREEAIRLGKKYVHNDICFPAQVVIGEALAALENGGYKDSEVAIGMAKYIGDCRLTHYGALLRKALDDAGYEDVPILTNDDKDYHNLHPGFRLSLISSIRIALALPMLDALEELLRKIRPYELVKGSANAAFERAEDALIAGIDKGTIFSICKGFQKGIRIMKSVRYDRSHPRPTVLIIGEYLLNFHPGANHDIEMYLENNGFEIIEAHMTDVIQKLYFSKDSQIQEFHLNKPWKDKLWYRTADFVFARAHDLTDHFAKEHPLYTRACRLPELVKDSDDIIHHTFDAGEGVLIPGEIIHHAKRGCRNFVILQPFGCLPNHVVGRGVTKRLKEMYPDVQILPLDYDPDVSFANIENRLQMLIMNMKAQKDSEEKKGA